MKDISPIPALNKAQTIRPLTEIEERECLAHLAAEVPDGGTIVETGTLYGGTTAVLALANPKAYVATIDTFEWHPPDGEPSSAEIVMENMKQIGAKNVTVLEGDSRKIGPTWTVPIDLLWIDGGHTPEIASADLQNFGIYAQVIAIHDYNNPYWKGVNQAVAVFLKEHPEFELTEVVHWVAVLKRKEE